MKGVQEERHEEVGAKIIINGKKINSKRSEGKKRNKRQVLTVYAGKVRCLTWPHPWRKEE